MENKTFTIIFFGLSIVALILAAIVSFAGVELYLAGTQWTLVSIVFSVYALYLKN